MNPSKIAENAIRLFLEELERREIRLDSRLRSEPLEETVAKAQAAAIVGMQEGTAELDDNWPGMQLEVRWRQEDQNHDLVRSMISKAIALRFAREEILEGVIPVTHVGRWLIGGGRITKRRDHAED